SEYTTYEQMDNDLRTWNAEKARLLHARVDLYKGATDLRARRDKFLSDKIAEASTETLAGIQKKLDDFPIKIRQIHVKDVDLVDRCESCHLGTREPVTLTKASMGGEEVFVSHPNKELLKIRDPEDLDNIQKQIGQLEQQKAEWEREIGFTIQKGDRTKDNAEAQRLYAYADDLKVRSSGLDAKVEQLDIRSKSLIREIKKVGPSLKEVRMKIRKEWLPVWIENPNHWRPGTKMPTFRLDKDEVHAIAAFVWHSH